MKLFRSRSPLTWVAIFLAVGLCAAWIARRNFCIDPYGTATYDSNTWKLACRYPDYNGCKRSQIVLDVMAKLSIGLSRTDALSILGTPDVPTSQCHAPWGGDCYWLGSLDGVEPNFLYVIYDTNGLISDRRLAWERTGLRGLFCPAV